MNRGKLKLIVLESMKDFGLEVEKHIKKIRGIKGKLIVPIEEPKFRNGDGKIVLKDSIRGCDVYILSDVYNYSLTYQINKYENHFSPNDHFRDITRTIAAIKGHANRVSVIMPLLYSSRQHRRKDRESLDCAVAIQELKCFYGVEQIVTVDAHDPAVEQSLPLNTFDNIYPTGLILKEFMKKEIKKINLDNLIIISPDTGATQRARFFANIFKCPLGIFSKQRDYTKVEDGRNKILSHDYAGPELKGKDAIIVDDMIDSGDSIIVVAEELKNKGVDKIYMIATFAIFSRGIEKIKEAHNKKLFDKLYTTNYTYIPEEFLKEKWIEVVDGTLLLAKIIDALNKDNSISGYVDEKYEVAKMIEEYK